ncbi:hypothetical protein, partial [Pseudomonas syringae group genomosp. 7]|uniref:hypothetical protein n=1 Tax=Pseudomonas syringae group genomosp. 7 TaxID=251699 RepID=UPI003770117F
TVIDIDAFDIRSKVPPFVYVDPLSEEAYDAIGSRFMVLSEELRRVQWEIGQCATLQHAADFLLTHYREIVPDLPNA